MATDVDKVIESCIEVCSRVGMAPGRIYPHAMAAVNSVNISGIRSAVRENLVAEIWDEKSDVNGVPPEDVKIFHGVAPGAVCFTIRDRRNGKIIIFQPFLQHVQGFVTTESKKDSREWMGMLYDEIVEDIVFGTVMDEVLTSLNVPKHLAYSGPKYEGGIANAAG